MAEKTKIGWADATWSPWRGCLKVSPGCALCYAEKQSKRNPTVLGGWGPSGPRVVNADWNAPLLWSRAAAMRGEVVKLFPSLCDPFEDYRGSMSDHRGNRLAETMDQFRYRFWNLMAETTGGAVWLLLTKRPENAVAFSNRRVMPAWLIASVEDQAHHDLRAWELAQAAAGYLGTGFSVEPQLRHIQLKSICPDCSTLTPHFTPGLHYATCDRCGTPTWRPDWVIVGGESGACGGGRGGARPFYVTWAMSIIRQCQQAKIPVFFKQLGSFALYDGTAPWAFKMIRRLWKHSGKPGGGLVRHRGEWEPGSIIELKTKDTKGEDPSEWPEFLRVQEFPKSWSPNHAATHLV